ncbi:MAG TPA: transcription antitermination factor NusB [Candidatus Paceibacterota bacterium]|nr:transcription antitermination factor NusB [Candidatus Paceibacterota bacterium]
MAHRHLSRSIVLQSLFEWDFRKLPDEEIANVVGRDITEYGPGLEDDAFILALTTDVLRHRSVVDDIITKAAPDWPLDKINVVDRNILRMGLTELLFGDRTQVPPKVAINESIELAKAFGGENSSKFINGVLGAVYKEIGEPGKDEVSKRKKDEPVDIESLPIEKKVGAVVYALHEGMIYLALVHDIFGYWTLSKGSLEANETPEEGIVRDIQEEIGLPIVVKTVLGENEYIASHPEKGKIRKQVTYFLGESPFQSLQLEQKDGLTDAKWFPVTEVPNLTTYDDTVAMIQKSVEFITSQN